MYGPIIAVRYDHFATALTRALDACEVDWAHKTSCKCEAMLLRSARRRVCPSLIRSRPSSKQAQSAAFCCQIAFLQPNYLFAAKIETPPCTSILIMLSVKITKELHEMPGGAELLVPTLATFEINYEKDATSVTASFKFHLSTDGCTWAGQIAAGQVVRARQLADDVRVASDSATVTFYLSQEVTIGIPLDVSVCKVFVTVNRALQVAKGAADLIKALNLPTGEIPTGPTQICVQYSAFSEGASSGSPLAGSSAVATAWYWNAGGVATLLVEESKTALMLSMSDSNVQVTFSPPVSVNLATRMFVPLKYSDKFVRVTELEVSKGDTFTLNTLPGIHPHPCLVGSYMINCSPKGDL